MSDFTYEINNRNKIYETYEWDNTWIDHPYDDVCRILYIGDSISCGMRSLATKKADGKMVFDLFGTSRSVDNPYFTDALNVFANQEGRRNAVVFNNGLHGFHLDDEKEYKEYYEKMVKYLLERFENTPVIIVLSTYIKRDGDLERVIMRNKSAAEIAEKYNLPVIDLYSVAEKAKDYISEDGIHFTTEGYEILADKIVDSLTDLLKI